MTRRAPAIALAATLVLVAAAVAVAGRRVAIGTVAKGSGASSSLVRRTAFVVRTQARWKEVWRSLNSGVEPTPARPRVDFSRLMLLVAVQGRRTSGGYSIAVTRVLDEGRRWRVSIDERSPGPTCIVPSVLTSPFHVVRVRRSSDTVTYVRHRRTASCTRR